MSKEVKEMQEDLKDINNDIKIGDSTDVTDSIKEEGKNVYLDGYSIKVKYDNIVRGIDFTVDLEKGKENTLSKRMEGEKLTMINGINTVIDYAMTFFILTLYISLLFFIMYKITTKYVPYVMKYIKKGLSKKESTRVTGFRSLIKYRLKGYTPMIISILYVIYLAWDITVRESLVCFVEGTLFYVFGFLLYVVLIMVIEYLLIQREIKNF